MKDKLAAELIEPYLMNLEGYPKIRFISQESCLKAMQAYHEARLKEELMDFLSYYHFGSSYHPFSINDEQRHGFITTVVDEYLKLRTNGTIQKNIH